MSEKLEPAKPIIVRGWLKKALEDGTRRHRLSELCRHLPDNKVAAAIRAVRKVMKEPT